MSSEVKIKFLVKSNAKKTKILGYDEWQDGIEIAISSPPEKGKANQELVEFLASLLSISKNNIQIISGKKSRVKVVEITGITQEKIAEILKK